MQVTINFDKSLARHEKFIRNLFTVARKYTSDVRLIGPMNGINAAHLSWKDAFELSSQMTRLVGKFGTDAVESMRLFIRNDVENTPFPVFD